MRKYDEIMERIEVTSSMRERILENIRREDLEKPASEKPVKLLYRSSFRRVLGMAACLAVLLLGVWVLPNRMSIRSQEPGTSPGPLLTNRIEDVSSIEELSQKVGFEPAEIPALKKDSQEITYKSYQQELAEIAYRLEDQTVAVRTSAGTEDNSGDYNLYEAAAEKEVHGYPVKLSGFTDGTYQLAVWTDGDYSYSVRLASPVTEEVFMQMISQIE